MTTTNPKPTTIKLKFLKAAMADPGLSPQAKCVMFALVIKHHNDETGRGSITGSYPHRSGR